MGEREIQHAVRLALGQEPGLLLWRNTGGVTEEWDESTHAVRVIRYGLGVGSADLIGLLGPRGRLFALEVKKPGSYPTKEQRAWAVLVRSLGGFCCVVRSAEEARAALARAREGALE